MAGAHATTPATAPQSPDDALRQQLVVRSHEHSTVVFCGDAEQVSAGFALAIALIDANEEFLIMSPKPDTERD
jgi:hypothetical protein